MPGCWPGEEASLFLEPKRFNSVDDRDVILIGCWEGAVKAVVDVTVRKRVARLASFVMVPMLKEECDSSIWGLSTGAVLRQSACHVEPCWRRYFEV